MEEVGYQFRQYKFMLEKYPIGSYVLIDGPILSYCDEEVQTYSICRVESISPMGSGYFRLVCISTSDELFAFRYGELKRVLRGEILVGDIVMFLDSVLSVSPVIIDMKDSMLKLITIGK